MLVLQRASSLLWKACLSEMWQGQERNDTSILSLCWSGSLLLFPPYSFPLLSFVWWISLSKSQPSSAQGDLPWTSKILPPWLTLLSYSSMPTLLSFHDEGTTAVIVCWTSLLKTITLPFYVQYSWYKQIHWQPQNQTFFHLGSNEIIKKTVKFSDTFLDCSLTDTIIYFHFLVYQICNRKSDQKVSGYSSSFQPVINGI